MIPILVFDLETIPDAQGLRRIHDLDASISDDDVVSQAQAARLEKTGSTFMPLHLQKIVAISCVFRDDKGFRVRSLGDLDDHEPKLLSDFFKLIERYTPQLVSWNGGGFDLPVLHYRCMLHGISAPRYWDWGDEDRDFKWNNYLSRYHTRHIDLMDVMAMYNGRANAPLDDLAKMCGFPGKLGMDGSLVWQAFQDGLLPDIRAYCETDVVNTYLLYSRFQLMRGVFNQAEYEAEIALIKQSLGELANEQPHWEEYLLAWDEARTN